MQVLIDYLTLTSKVHTIENLIDLLGLWGVNFIQIKSFLGYAECKYYNGIKLHYGGREDVCIDLSGKGCRTLEEVNKNLNFDWFEFMEQFSSDIIDKNIHISRLDVACDDFTGLITVNKLVPYVKQKKYICKSDYVIHIDLDEEALYFGSPKSDRRLRIYNKGLQMKFPSCANWTRAEFQLRNDNALSFYLNWLYCDSLGECFAGVLIDYLRFVSKSVLEMSGKNYHRLSTTSWWKKFTDNASRIKQSYLQGFKYDIETCKRYLEKQCSSSIKTLLTANGGDISELLEMVEKAQYNKQQKELLGV